MTEFTKQDDVGNVAGDEVYGRDRYGSWRGTLRFFDRRDGKWLVAPTHPPSARPFWTTVREENG